MGAKLKVLKGMRSTSAARLCDSCQSGLVRKGAAESDEQVYCLVIERDVKTWVVECNRYVDRTLPPLWEMHQIAWVLRTDSKRHAIGFVPAIGSASISMKSYCHQAWINSKQGRTARYGATFFPSSARAPARMSFIA